MTLVFFGTAEFAVPALRAIAASSHTILAVVTQPDRPTGRGMKLHSSPVCAAAVAVGLPVMKPEKCRDPEFIEQIGSMEPDVLVVAAYGQIMPVALLESAKFGGINIHGSLLPRWRGAAPIQRAIQHGDSKTGITIMQMDKGMDTGDILMQDEMPILSDATAEFVTHWLAELGALMIVRALDRLPDLTRTPQGGSLATYAPRIKPEEGRIDWGRTSVEIYNMYRAFTPRPGVFATAGGKRLKIIEMRPAGDGGEPGIVTSVISGGILVAAGSGSLQLIRVKPEGKPEMSGTALAIGHGIRPGSRFGL